MALSIFQDFRLTSTFWVFCLYLMEKLMSPLLKMQTFQREISFNPGVPQNRVLSNLREFFLTSTFWVFYLYLMEKLRSPLLKMQSFQREVISFNLGVPQNMILPNLRELRLCSLCLLTTLSVSPSSRHWPVSCGDSDFKSTCDSVDVVFALV